MIHFQHLRRRKYFAVIDFISVCVSVALAFYIRTKVPLPVFTGLLPEGLPAGFGSFIVPASVLGFIFVSMQYAFGVYDLWHSSSTTNWLQKVLPANLAMLTASFTYLYLAQNFNFPRSLIVAMFVLNNSFSTLWRVVYFKITEAEISDVVLVGTWPDISGLLADLSSPPFSKYVRVSAVFAPDCSSESFDQGKQNYRVLPLDEFDSYTNDNPYTSVILAPSDSFHRQTFSFVLAAARRGLSIYAVPTIYEVLLGKLQHLRINDLPLVELRIKQAKRGVRWLKRLLDLAGSLLLLLLLAVPMCLIALLIKLSSPGPIFYSQIRVGRDGREFRIFKFRSMVVDAEKDTGATLATKDDPRLTPVGSFMRKTRLDELPQLWNILNGTMTFVGPRPERPNFVRAFEKQIPGYSERCRVRPGVTGLAQVSGGYHTTPEIKLKYDLAYVANQNLLLDLQILIRTLKVVITRAGQ